MTSARTWLGEVRTRRRSRRAAGPSAAARRTASSQNTGARAYQRPGCQASCGTSSSISSRGHDRPTDYRGDVLSDSIVEAGISTTSRFLAVPDFDAAERVAGARCRLPSVSVSAGLMSSDGKARIPSCVTTSPTSSLWSSPRLFAGVPSKMVRRASTMGLSCSLKLFTSTPRGYADRLSVVRTTEYVALDQSSDRIDRNVLLPHPTR